MNEIKNEIRKEVNMAIKGLEEYAETLEDTYVCTKHLDKILELLDKLEKGEK